MSAESNPDRAPVGDRYLQQWKALGGWFLGPRAENQDVFMDIFKDVFAKHVELRNNYFPSDPAYITEEIKSSRPYRCEVEDIKEQLMKMQDQMDGNVPFFSPRYQAHMLWDITMPAILGYMGAMLFNQNNVDSAASPVTTLYEQRVGRQLCDMLGYNIDYDEKNPKKPLGWGHITCGGSIANIEALWASRNIKFVPLAVRAALQYMKSPEVINSHGFTKEQLDKGLNTKVNVYHKQGDVMKETPLDGCSKWQLLNVDIDVICDLPESVMDFIFRDGNGKLIDNITEDEFDKRTSEFKVFVEKEGVMSKGLVKMLRDHGLEDPPVYLLPANNHYSWPKAGKLLGLGSDALIPVQLDLNFRQDVKDLEKKLNDCLEHEIPVLSVAAVMGSTEESAVDPIQEMHELREKFKAKGLDFALLADGAWGGYFKTMLIERSRDEPPQRDDDDFIPYCSLTDYVRKQYEHIQLADTITIDPHKSGFCPYPGGGLCYRNGKMRYPIALFHPEVFHGEGDPTMGVYGIEGSKPGAAPAGILMSHNVIGLSNRGYGRILGQCTATARLFYSLWLTVARDDDPFECVPLQQLPDGYKDLDATKKMIREKMAYKSMSEVYADEQLKGFLDNCGPDTLINTFVVRHRDYHDIEHVNKLQVALSDAMNIFVGTDACRVPLMLMQSGLDAKKHGEGLKEFKKRAHLVEKDPENPENMNVMVNCCMNPWQWNESIFLIGDLFRRITLNCIGRIEDKQIEGHRFILAGTIPDAAQEADPSLFLEYLTDTAIPEKQYQVSVKVKVALLDEESNQQQRDDKAIEMLRKYIKDHATSEILFELASEYNPNNENVPNLYNILNLKDWKQKLHLKLVNAENQPVIAFKILDLPRYQRLDLSSEVSYPEHQKYFIYGDSTQTIMSHVMSQLSDFQHTVTLSGRPHSMTQTMLTQGVIADMEEVEGSPLYVDGKMTNPLQRSCYNIAFTGELHASIDTTINIKELPGYFMEIPKPPPRA